MPDFVPGRELCRSYFEEIVTPLLHELCPNMPYAAGLFGAGSEVLGFDTPMSTDHNWGPRVQIVVDDETLVVKESRERLAARLPASFRGWQTLPVEFPSTSELITKIFGPQAKLPFEAIDWLLVTQQELRSLIDGPIFLDEIDLAGTRSAFNYFPKDVYHYLLAALWSRIGEEEHLVGRAGFVGDELGARLIAARLVRDLMRLGFMLERTYSPYPKWFGTGYRRLAVSTEMEPLLNQVLDAKDWHARDSALSKAYERVADQFNSMALTPQARPTVRLFHERPFHVLCYESGIVEALLAGITDPKIQRWATGRPIGSIEMFSDSTDLLEDRSRRLELKALYAEPS